MTAKGGHRVKFIAMIKTVRIKIRRVCVWNAFLVKESDVTKLYT